MFLSKNHTVLPSNSSSTSILWATNKCIHLEFIKNAHCSMSPWTWFVFFRSKKEKQDSCFGFEFILNIIRYDMTSITSRLVSFSIFSLSTIALVSSISCVSFHLRQYIQKLMGLLDLLLIIICAVIKKKTQNVNW